MPKSKLHAFLAEQEQERDKSLKTVHNKFKILSGLFADAKSSATDSQVQP